LLRRRLKRIGFTSSFDSLPYVKADIFLTIDETVDKMQSEEMKKKK